MMCPASEYDDCSHSEDITLECSKLNLLDIRTPDNCSTMIISCHWYCLVIYIISISTLQVKQHATSFTGYQMKGFAV